MIRTQGVLRKVVGGVTHSIVVSSPFSEDVELTSNLTSNHTVRAVITMLPFAVYCPVKIVGNLQAIMCTGRVMHYSVWSACCKHTCKNGLYRLFDSIALFRNRYVVCDNYDFTHVWGLFNGIPQKLA